MKCRECGSEMFLEDKDFNFKGNYDEYWLCSECFSYCIFEFRYSKPFKETWHSEYNDIIKDYVIKHNL